MPAQDAANYLIVGGGVASAQGAVGIREVDATGSVRILCGEPRLPYDRPPLSKSLLLGKTTPEDAESKDPSFYTDKSVEVTTGAWVESVDRSAKKVRTKDGVEFKYDKLLLATGSKPNKLASAKEAPNLYYLRTVEDSLAIREAFSRAKSVVFVGCGYIGMEVASAALKAGLEVTLVDPADHPWAKFASPTSGNFLRRAFEHEGASFRLGQEVKEVEGGDKVQLSLGSGERIQADMAVIGVGVSQYLDLAKGSGLECNHDGVLVDATLRSSDPDIYVAGDIAAFDDLAIGRRWHAEHYLNARWQGHQAGRNMAGAMEVFEKVPYFFSDLLDLHMILRGDPISGKSVKVLGSVEEGEFIEIYAREDGTLAMGIAWSHSEPRLDPWSDKLEAMVKSRTKVGAINEASFELDADLGLG